MCKFSLKSSVLKCIQNLLANIVQSDSFCSRLPKELKNVEKHRPEVCISKALVW